MPQIEEGFVIKDSGERQGFDTGAVRDTDEGKPRYELLPITALKRIALHYAKGAKKYNDDNWRKGMPYRRMYGSLLRHAYAFGQGDMSEDHLAAVCFNAMSIMHYQSTGREELNNMPEDGKYESNT